MEKVMADAGLPVMAPRDDSGASKYGYVGMLMLAALCGVGVVLAVVSFFPSEALGVVGVWLLLYRAVIRTKYRGYVQDITSACIGVSIIVLAPALPWPAGRARFATLALFGVLITPCGITGLSFTSLGCSLSIGMCFGSLLWQLGLCSAQSPWGHPALMLFCGAIFIVVWNCTPVARSEELVLYPVLAALLVVESLAPHVGLLSNEALFEASCPTENISQKARLTGLVWLLLAACAVAWQWFLLRPVESQGEEKDSLIDSLLPSAGHSTHEQNNANNETNGKTNGPMADSASMPAKDAGVSRFPVLAAAMYAPEDADMSHLTEHERKLVEICRKDEFERDRVLWGGGLL